MSQVREDKSTRITVDDEPETRELVIRWEYEECTHRSASAFARMSRKALLANPSLVLLDMSGCKFLSVNGLRSVLEWHSELARNGIELKITGLLPEFQRIIACAKLEWLLA